MKRCALIGALATIAAGVCVIGCGTDEAKVRELARDEAQKMINMQYTTPEKFGFGVSWEKDFSYSQGTRVGNLLFIAGQFAHARTVDANGNPTEDLMTGKNFEQQFRATLENIKAVLDHYGGTMDDVVFLQNFVDPEAGGLKAGDYNAVAAPMIREYFPNGLHAMTFVEVVNLYGEQQLVESNAIAILKPKTEASPQ